MAGQVIADTATEVEFSSVNDDSCVPDTIYLPTDHLSGELASHPIRKIVNV